MNTNLRYRVFWVMSACAMLFSSSDRSRTTAAADPIRGAAAKHREDIVVQFPSDQRVRDGEEGVKRLQAGQGQVGILFVAAVVPENEDGEEVAVELWESSITHQELDQGIFGSKNPFGVLESKKTLEMARAEFDVQLKARVEDMLAKYELDETQRRKLLLAGRGDINRLFSQVEALYSQVGDETRLNEHEYLQIQQTALALRTRLAQAKGRGLFDEQSFFCKTIPKVLGPKLAEQFVADQQRQFENQLTQSLHSLTPFFTLRENQIEQLKKLIRAEIPPPARFNQQSVYMSVLYQLSQMPDDKVTKVFDDSQIGKLGVIKVNAATYEKYLRTNGLLTDEPDDGRQEDAE